jgi:hypothetical protein
MSFLSRLFGSKSDDEGHQPPSMPWDRRPSILDFVRSHMAAGKPGMAEGGYTLPDEEQVNAGSKIRWAAGAMDGVTTHHMESGRNDPTVRRTVDLVLSYSRQPTAINKAAVYQHIIVGHVVSDVVHGVMVLYGTPAIGTGLVPSGIHDPSPSTRSKTISTLRTSAYSFTKANNLASR